MNSQFLLAMTLVAGFHSTSKAAEPANPAAVVETMETKFGVHPGYRRNHAKGLCVVGDFKAAKEAAAYSSSPLFSGKTISFLGRFSVAGGVPETPDTAGAPRGLALRFNLGAAGFHNMAMLNVPVFVASTPEAFAEFLKVGTPEATKAYLDTHPEAGPFMEYMKTYTAPASYATESFQSLHAFEFTNKAKKAQFVRWSFVPTAGVSHLAADQAASKGPNFLSEELASRLKKGAAKWDLEVTLAQDGDSLIDATKAWPADRKKIRFGTLRITKLGDKKKNDCDGINFDPNTVSAGVKPSDDPVLKFRSAAYAVSYGKRLSDPKTEKK